MLCTFGLDTRNMSQTIESFFFNFLATVLVAMHDLLLLNTYE